MTPSACILNTGGNAWAFQPIAAALASRTGLPIASAPSCRNYLLGCDSLPDPDADQQYFVPIDAIQLASDKRLIAECFNREGVATPKTVLIEDLGAAKAFASKHNDHRWCIKYPTGCAASGHRLLDDLDVLPFDWPRPLVIQEFIQMSRPEVYRAYTVAGEMLGWMVRRYPTGKTGSPWVAHARGARYEDAGEPPADAMLVAKQALEASGLASNFGCVDLVHDDARGWLALEVGTDGGHSYVDRDIDNKALENQLFDRLSIAISQFASQ